jgi:hypothetical protein
VVLLRDAADVPAETRPRAGRWAAQLRDARIPPCRIFR